MGRTDLTGHDTPDEYLAGNPFADALARRISEGRVVDDELRRLADAADRLDDSRGKGKSPQISRETEPPTEAP
jgi:hypothetical protein